MHPRYRLLVFLLIFITLLGLFYTTQYGEEFSIYLHQLTRRTQNCKTIPRYTNFGVILPSTYTVHGIDVSQYQDHIYWNEVKKMNVKGNQIRFVFIRATMGHNRTDSDFDENWANAKRYGLLRGAYHYFDTKQDAALQAKNFLRTADLQSGDLPPVLDIETVNGVTVDELTEALKVWLDAVEKETNTKPIIYTNMRFYKKYIKPNFKKYPLWIAHYYEDDIAMPNNEDWLFWQHHDQGQVNGICGDVDFNVFNGNFTALKKICLD